MDSMVPSLLTGQSYDVSKETSWTSFPSDNLFWENPVPLINILVSPHKLPYGGLIENTSAPKMDENVREIYLLGMHGSKGGGGPDPWEIQNSKIHIVK